MQTSDLTFKGFLAGSELAEFLKHLETDDLEPDRASRIGTFEGFLRRSEDNNFYEIAPRASCNAWIKIPTDQLVSARFVSLLARGDHSHAYFVMRVGPLEEWLAALFNAISKPAIMQQSLRSAKSSQVLTKGFSLLPPTVSPQGGDAAVGTGYHPLAIHFPWQPPGQPYPIDRPPSMDIWLVSNLNNNIADYGFHPNGYCMTSSGVAYHGPTTIVNANGPYAMILYTSKGSCL